MKTILRLIITGLFLTAPTGLAWPVAKSYPVSAQVPSVVIATIALTKVMAVDRTNPVNWIKDQTAINFGTLQYNRDIGIWLPDNFYVIDVASNFGGKSGYIGFSYVDVQKPDGQGEGLGRKTTATFMKLTSSDATGQPISPMKELIDINTVQIAPDAIRGGWLRVYISIATGETVTGQPFATDKPGPYSGALTVNIVTS